MGSSRKVVPGGSEDVEANPWNNVSTATLGNLRLPATSRHAGRIDDFRRKCSCEHMSRPHHTPEQNEELRVRLRAARESLQRAWQVLQIVRILLEEVGCMRLPPAGRRKDIRAEGKLLTSALERLLREEHQRFDHLADAIEKLRPFLSHHGDPSFPYRVIELNRALDPFLRVSSETRLERHQTAQWRIQELGSSRES